MSKKETLNQTAIPLPMLKTVEQMSKVSGIGENKIRELMDSGELEYIQNGNRRLIADSAIWEWYNRTKKKAQPRFRQEGSNDGSIGKKSSKQKRQQRRPYREARYCL